MAETIRDRINDYLQDTIAAERNFEHALAAFGKSGVQADVQQLLSMASVKAKTQHMRLEALLRSRGGSPSEAKTLLAEMLAFAPLSAQIGQGAAEKNTQHLMVTFAAAAAEMAMYESLAAAASVAGDAEVVTMARELQKEERDDYDQVWSLIQHSAASSFQDEAGKDKTSQQILCIYLEDAIAAEKSFEDQLEGFAKEADNPAVQTLFTEHARETRDQYERLTVLLQQRGGTTSTVKSLLAHMFNFAPKVAQVGYDASERLTQNLMMAYSVENAEVAMYECLQVAARQADDGEVERLAYEIQQQEKATAEKLWAHLGPQAERAVSNLIIAKAS